GATLAFWSTRLGNWHVFLAGPDGSGARPVAGIEQRYDLPEKSLVFSPDGRWLLVPVVDGPPDTIFASQLWLVDVRSATARRLPGACEFGLFSPDSRLIACGGDGAGLLSLSGRRLARLPGSPRAWSSTGLLATQGDRVTDVVDARGRKVLHTA